MVQLRYEEIMEKVRGMQKKRTFYIPKSAFIKRSSKFNMSTDLTINLLTKIAEKKRKVILTPREKRKKEVREWQAKKKNKGLKKRNKNWFKISFNDAIIPDEIFDSSDYKSMKTKLFVKNMHKRIVQFYKQYKINFLIFSVDFNKKENQEIVRMLATWLLTLSEFNEYCDGFRKILVHTFSLEEISDKYRKKLLIYKFFLVFYQDDKVDKIYILIQGCIRMFVDNRRIPLQKTVYVINEELLNAIGPIPTNKSVFVIGNSYFLTMDLNKFLKVKKDYRQKHGNIFKSN